MPNFEVTEPNVPSVRLMILKSFGQGITTQAMTRLMITKTSSIVIAVCVSGCVALRSRSVITRKFVGMISPLKGKATRQRTRRDGFAVNRGYSFVGR